MNQSRSLSESLRKSLRHQHELSRRTLILNPVENIPLRSIFPDQAVTLHGFYNTDKLRSREESIAADIQFAGRRQISRDIAQIYREWRKALQAEELSLRLLSGLHAHIVVFMGLSQGLGEKVLLLPESAGGHMSTKAILERLGFQVIEMAVDLEAHKVDANETMRLYSQHQPDFIFVDRSEGLVYEDFAWVGNCKRALRVFDGSQYLSNIIAGDHTHPFEMGFDMMLSSIHKNFPGPQKALICARRSTPAWSRLISRISTYVSNMHIVSMYAAGLALDQEASWEKYSFSMLQLAVKLEQQLADSQLPVVRRLEGQPTHHLWIRLQSREEAFNLYSSLERCRILTNYRKLPYGQGFGLRLGTAAAVRQGLGPDCLEPLAEIIEELYRSGPKKSTRQKAKRLIAGLGRAEGNENEEGRFPERAES